MGRQVEEAHLDLPECGILPKALAETSAEETSSQILACGVGIVRPIVIEPYVLPESARRKRDCCFAWAVLSMFKIQC